jgi:hypothetical protein
MYVVKDKDGNLYGPFENARHAAGWAVSKWPGQIQDERTAPHREGWSVVAIRPAD